MNKDKKKKATVRISLPPQRPTMKDTIRISLPPAQSPAPPPSPLDQGVPTSEKAPIPPSAETAKPAAPDSPNPSSSQKLKTFVPKPPVFLKAEKEDKDFPTIETSTPPVAAIPAPATQPIPVAEISPAPEVEEVVSVASETTDETNEIASAVEILNTSSKTDGSEPLLFVAMPLSNKAVAPSTGVNTHVNSTKEFDMIDMILSIVAAIVTISATAMLYFKVLGSFAD
jgi:hypothetical protein